MTPANDSETILVVDDDAAVREIIARSLRAHGYFVLEATDGEHALVVAGEHAAPIHLIVSDVNMPEMGGWTLLSQLRGWYPGIRILLISGYPQDVGSMKDLENTPTAFLAKPFMPDELVQAARDLLDRPRTH